MLYAKLHQNNLPCLVPDALLHGGLELRDARYRLLLVELLEHLAAAAAAAAGSTAILQLGILVVESQPSDAVTIR